MFFKTMVNERKSLLVPEDSISRDKDQIQFSCCPKKDYEEMMSLIESDPGIVNRPNRGSNKTLLHRCIEHHRLCMVEYLLTKDALQLRDASGNLPLHSHSDHHKLSPWPHFLFLARRGKLSVAIPRSLSPEYAGESS